VKNKKKRKNYPKLRLIMAAKVRKIFVTIPVLAGKKKFAVIEKMCTFVVKSEQFES
jgi:hypothetical protein